MMKSFNIVLAVLTIAIMTLVFSCGNDESTAPNNEIEYGTVTDIDGNVYNTVKIGNQWWMAENLNVSHYRNGEVISEVSDSTEWESLTTGAWCYYNNDSENGKVYGKLYNWYAVNDPRGLSPAGWHVPSESEFIELWNFLGGMFIAGGKLKSTGTIEKGTGLWYEPNLGASNQSGFKALPGGWFSGKFFI